MYEDLETIATLKFGKEMESISERTRTNVREAQCQYAALTGASGVRSGQHEASIARIWIVGSEQLARSLFDIWVDLIKQRNGHIDRGDIAFVASKIEVFTRSQTGHLRKVFSQRPSTLIPMLSEEAERRMYAVSASARRDLEIMAREHDAFAKIAAVVNITPKPPAPVPASSDSSETPAPPPKKPNYGVFVGIIGSAIPLVLAILLANGVDVNWQASLDMYIVLACVCAWSFWKHAVPHKSGLIRNGGAFLFFSVIAAIGIYGTVKQYRKEHPRVTASHPSPQEGGSQQGNQNPLQQPLVPNTNGNSTKVQALGREGTTNANPLDLVDFNPFKGGSIYNKTSGQIYVLGITTTVRSLGGDESKSIPLDFEVPAHDTKSSFPNEETGQWSTLDYQTTDWLNAWSNAYAAYKQCAHPIVMLPSGIQLTQLREHYRAENKPLPVGDAEAKITYRIGGETRDEILPMKAVIFVLDGCVPR
ncbi:MAG: hypothetical protein ABSF57_09520 [Acidobacteriaceae bacterium]